MFTVVLRIEGDDAGQVGDPEDAESWKVFRSACAPAPWVAS